jgi:hypothetical protein
VKKYLIELRARRWLRGPQLISMMAEVTDRIPEQVLEAHFFTES